MKLKGIRKGYRIGGLAFRSRSPWRLLVNKAKDDSAQAADCPIMGRVRGIVNRTTACHVTSSLVLLCHCLPPVREAILQSVARLEACSSNSNQDLLLRELAFFLQDYYVSGDDGLDGYNTQPVEVPSRLYRALLSEAGIQAQDVGDAVTTLAKLLDYLRRCAAAPEVATTLKNALDGSCYRVIQDGCRRKILHPRAMPCPYPVRILDGEATTLLECIRRTLQPQVVRGYQWMGEFERLSSETPPLHADPDTTKELVLERLPPMWIIHLDRFVNNARTRDPAGSPVVDVPLFLDASSLGSNAEYRLMGAVVHVSEGKHQNEEADESAGHTIAVVQDQENDAGRSHPETNWFIVDDEKVTSISTIEAIRMISGCQTDQGGVQGGVVLVYGGLGVCWRDVLQLERAAGTQQSTLNAVDWTKPIQLIGRRVNVKWARDDWYSGTVSAYDPSSRKHTVTYDDGDVRSYDLKRKTIEWL